MPLVLRLRKGSSLTNSELDDNFIYLDQQSLNLQSDLQTVVDDTIPQLETNFTALLNTKQNLNAKLTSLSGVGTDGMLSLSGSTVNTRTIVPGSANITVTNGDGVSGNPTIDIAPSVLTQTGTQIVSNKTILGSNNTIGDIPLATATVGVLPVSKGGTGVTSQTQIRTSIDALISPVSNGLVVKTGADQTVVRSIAVTGSGLTISNANGLDGNPTVTSNATTTNTANTLVFRDASGNFAAGTITATLNGHASTAGSVTNGVVTTGSYSDPSWITSLAGSKVSAIPNASLSNYTITINGTPVPLGGSINFTTGEGASTNTPNTLVKRDASGNFAAGTITGTLIGSATSAQTAVNATNASFSTTQAPGTNNTTIATTAFVRAAVNAATSAPTLGVGQTWQNVTSSRVLGTTYTNNTGAPINVFVIINAANTQTNGYVNGIQVAHSSAGNHTTSVSFIVPVAATYSVTTSSSTLQRWAELR